MPWRAMKLPNGCRQENTCLCPMSLSLYKVTELDPLWYKMRVLCIMKMKLTGNEFANETDKRTKRLLSKMSPTVFKKYIVHLSLSFSYNEVSHSVERSYFQNRFFKHTQLDVTTSHCRSFLIKSLSFFPSPRVSATCQVKVSLFPFSFHSQLNKLTSSSFPLHSRL